MIKHTIYINSAGLYAGSFVEYINRNAGVIFARSFNCALMSDTTCDELAEQHGVNIARIITAE